MSVSGRDEVPGMSSNERQHNWMHRLFGGRLAWNEAKWGYIFIIPWVLGFIIFTLGPLIASLYFSFTEYTVITPPKWIGLGNYRQMFSGDPLFWKSVQVTLQYVSLRVPIGVVAALCGAIILNQHIKGRVVFRTLFFIPSITPGVAAILLWTFLLQRDYGLVNSWLALVGIEGPGWLSDPRWAVPSLAFLGIWGSVGGNQAIIFLSALQDIPQTLYEAARVDGANWFQLQRYVTLPMLTPAIFFVTVMAVIGTFQVFTAAYVGTGGGPAYATHFYVLHLYQKAFGAFQMGYSSAMAWFLALVLLVVTLVQTKLSERWVYYAGG